MARGVPIVACSSLSARAALVPGEPCVLAVLDAKRERVYAGAFRTEGAAPEIVGDERDARLADVLPSAPFVAVGEGALVFADALLAAGARIAPIPALLRRSSSPGWRWRRAPCGSARGSSDPLPPRPGDHPAPKLIAPNRHEVLQSLPCATDSGYVQ
jgi:hypothetical protein